MKKLFTSLTAFLGFGTATLSQAQDDGDYFFVFAKIEDQVLPIERGEKYEDPLDEALRQMGYGEVSGGGTMQNKDGSIAWIGVDIDLTNTEQGIPFVKKKLIELGVPKGSVLEYQKGGEKFTDPIYENEN